MTDFKVSRRGFVAGTAAAGAAAAVVSATGLKAGTALAAQTDKTVTVRLARDIQVLDPGYMVGGAEQITQWAVLPRLALMRAGDEWGWEPTDFVTKLEQTDDLSIAFTLRPGHMWSDGFGELTSEDVKYSIERLKDSEWSGKWESISHVEVIDKYNGLNNIAFTSAPFWLGRSEEHTTELHS
ncbi:MAG: ABC transporter substrate-binding protein, partial [Alphaproteobacteria bacterium]